MSIDNKNQLENTRLKLQELEQLYVETKQDASTSEHVRELTLRSLRKRINQFKEEITRFAARDTSGCTEELNRCRTAHTATRARPLRFEIRIVALVEHRGTGIARHHCCARWKRKGPSGARRSGAISIRGTRSGFRGPESRARAAN
jgi:hypothetical protein